MTISLATLRTYVNKSMGDICLNGFTDPGQNHCAHFVSHVLNIQYGTLCNVMTTGPRAQSATIRVNEIYNRLTTKGTWASQPSNADGLLIFVTSARNVSAANIMAAVSRKHVGIHHSGKVFNFANMQHKVVEETVAEFHTRIQAVYSADNDVSLFYGVFQ